MLKKERMHRGVLSLPSSALGSFGGLASKRMNAFQGKVQIDVFNFTLRDELSVDLWVNVLLIPRAEWTLVITEFDDGEARILVADDGRIRKGVGSECDIDVLFER